MTLIGNTIVSLKHLVTLRVLLQESCLRDTGLYCCFVDFKKSFDLVPGEHLWRHMSKLELPSEYMLVISRTYKKAICCVHMGNGISEFFNSTSGVT